MSRKKIVFVYLILFVFVFGSCSRSESGANNANTEEIITPRSIFGAYPAEYRIAYFNMLGITPVPTVMDLFGPEAKFLTSFEGIPAVVTLEEANGDENEFSGQLLLTLKPPERDEIRGMRLLVTFVSDKTSEFSYCRYIRLVNLLDGSSTERRSNGTQNSDALVLGVLVGSMEYFWDTSN